MAKVTVTHLDTEADRNSAADFMIGMVTERGASKQSAPNYAAMKDHELLEALGDDGAAWAAAFCQVAKEHGQDIDEGWMIGWFANAIEASWAKRTRRAEPQTRPVPLCNWR